MFNENKYLTNSKIRLNNNKQFNFFEKVTGMIMSKSKKKNIKKIIFFFSKINKLCTFKDKKHIIKTKKKILKLNFKVPKKNLLFRIDNFINRNKILNF